MNKLEFNEVIKNFDGMSYQEYSYPFDKKVYNYLGNEFYLYPNGYVCFKGLVPYEIAVLLFTKYPNSKYGIRVWGGHEDCNPGNYVSNKDGKKYITSYHIDSKEGLVYLLTELKYMSERTKINSVYLTKEEDQKRILSNINEELIKKTNLKMTTEEWLEKERKINLLGSVKNNKLKILLKEFDMIINPFMNEKLDINNPVDYSTDVIFTFNKDKHNEARYYLQNNENDDYIAYIRNKKEQLLIYKIGYKKETGTIFMQHVFDTKNNEETIDIYFTPFNDEMYSLEYSLTSNLVGSAYEEKKTPNEYELQYMHQEVEEVLAKAKEIVFKYLAKEKQKINIK